MSIKITMNGVASYIAPAVLETDKKVTLVYGLNGTGKSTLSNYLLDPTNSMYAGCVTAGLDNAQVYVYNSRFVKDNFHEMDKLKGIFTLSKSNKHAEEQLETAKQDLKNQTKTKEALDKSIAELTNGVATAKTQAEEVTWKIKTQFAGGDRVLEFCLEGLKGTKGRLFDHIAGLPLPAAKPIKTTDDLRSESEALSGDKAQHFAKLPKLASDHVSIEKNSLWSQAIIGNQDSSISALIKRLDSADWVSEGIPFMEALQKDGDQHCPFCQAETINAAVSNAIKGYFDETFSNSVAELKELLQSYRVKNPLSQPLSSFLDAPLMGQKTAEFEALYGQLDAVLASNSQMIEGKIKSPSSVITFADSAELVEKLNAIIETVNAAVQIHNDKINNKTKALGDIKSDFWKICRWEYDQTILAYNASVKASDDNLKARKDELKPVDEAISALRQKMADLQKETVNVDAAVAVINTRLADLGIDSFKIIRHGENTYRLSRNGIASEDFQSLSEGEKTVISFVYFIELCKGKRSADDVAEHKVVIIDDPISSLSHVYVFNIGQMIKQELFNSERFSQVMVLTHSLYFFYELTDIRKDRRDLNQKLLRLVKNSSGSHVVEMKYEEVQNDYQAYWTVINDKQQHPALIANCMRNIIEYFFNFVRKHDLNNVFQSPKLSDVKHQAFYRFMNRESHSLGQNILDYKEFDYDKFHEAFKLLFEESGFSEHYKAMTK
jgi:wobble nucleotide-excising tRNase